MKACLKHLDTESLASRSLLHMGEWSVLPLHYHLDSLCTTLFVYTLNVY